MYGKEVSLIINLLPQPERFNYRDQISRCSILNPSNIEEGSSRNSNKGFKRYLQIALGFSFELETQLMLLEQNEILSIDRLSNALRLKEEVQKMLQTLMKRLN